jgi:hypothetical protein
MFFYDSSDVNICACHSSRKDVVACVVVSLDMRTSVPRSSPTRHPTNLLGHLGCVTSYNKASTRPGLRRPISGSERAVEDRRRVHRLVCVSLACLCQMDVCTSMIQKDIATACSTMAWESNVMCD